MNLRLADSLPRVARFIGLGEQHSVFIPSYRDESLIHLRSLITF